MIIAIDFDGTCVTHDYPEVGRDIGAGPVLRDLVAVGHQIILWTMRGKEPLIDALDWFQLNKIPVFGINANPEQHEWTTSPKAYAHLYIDDAALGVPLIYGEHGRPFVDWQTVRRQLAALGLFALLPDFQQKSG